MQAPLIKLKYFSPKTPNYSTNLIAKSLFNIERTLDQMQKFP